MKLHHCDCDLCNKARSDMGFDIFLAVVFGGLYAAGIYAAIRFIIDAFAR
jgi:hypothetical protein